MDIAAHDIIIEDAKMRYIVAGPTTNMQRTLLFLHGWRSDAGVWAQVMARLDDGVTSMIAPDLPGFGGSEAPKRPEGIAGYREAVSALMDRLSLRGVVVIGHSFGGSIAAMLGAVHPELVSRLVLVNSAGIRRATAQKRVKRGIARTVKPLFRPKFMQPLRRAVYTAMGAEDYVETPHLVEHYRRIVSEDISGYLEQISQPTLLVWGEDDEETPLADAEVLRDGIAHADLVVLKGAGHFSFLDKPEEFIESIQTFLA